jgi:N-carbamoyl-L-amino-acid hydrolase
MAAGLDLQIEFSGSSRRRSIEFDRDCVALVRDAARELNYPARDIASAAAHDACHLARIVPTAMIFVPCRDGISHNERESAEPEHLAAGADVLLHAMLQRAR